MRLHEQVKHLQAKLDLVNSDLTEKLAYLGGSKFQGNDNNFVNAREMYTFIIELRGEL